MACFIVSAAVAAGTSAARHLIGKSAKKSLLKGCKEEKSNSMTKWSERLKYLELSLWGGSFLLAGEHVIHGEVTFLPPFLTAMKSAEDTAEMLSEMKTVGVSMCLSIIAAWAIGVLICEFVSRRRTRAEIMEKA